MVMSKIHSFCGYHLTQHEDTLHLNLLWTTSYKAKNWRSVTFKLAAILDLKVKTRSNCKTDIKNEFLDPKNPRNHILHSSFSQTIENYFSRWPTADILDFCQLRLMPTLLRATPLQFHSLTFKEDKNTMKRTFALHGHGSASDDPTIMLMTHYLKQFWETVIMFCTHTYQKTSINTIILGNAHITKPSYLKQLT